MALDEENEESIARANGSAKLDRKNQLDGVREAATVEPSTTQRRFNMIIWIVRKHPMHPYRSGHISAFTIVSTHKNRADAAAIVNKKNSNRNTYMLYTVGKVCIKENQ